eukprot:CAMPEP_0201524134 /NCGR_PEP_ID=MMETSP0161_2-20130828/21131_1 /ASSEMBLY_ACC=CAM_ASM_000251 /TAXON_ID=180227 /ORGANISM="Neoparamoeba aestuarina, Strain SoJaBio B1-5/56/2" /LENGTH=264 /DNA_ID=CAMNT_0047923417 /DNA_START=88 /DNA_END=882 /DNA_ORIENTATION=+
MSTPTVPAMLFEIRELQRTAVACKFRYTQLENASKKAATVRAWREIHHKKAILKIVCRSCYAQREAEEKLQKEQAAKRHIPTPPVLPEWLVQSAIRSALKNCPAEEATTVLPNPPPMPPTVMLQAAKKALRPSPRSENPAHLPHPPPLPAWVQSMILKETRNKLRHPHFPPTHRQPPPLPGWVHLMILKQTKNKLRKQIAPRPPIPLSKTIFLHHHFLVSARQSLRSVDLVCYPPTDEGRREELRDWEGLADLFLPSYFTLSVP